MIIKKFLGYFIFLILVLGVGFNLQAYTAQRIINDNQLSITMDKYFYKKDSSDLAPIMNYLSTSPLLSQKHAKAPIEGFFMGIYHENPTAFNQLEKMQLSNQALVVLKVAKEFSPDMERILSNKQNYYPESPAFLDMLWGYWRATGDNRVINKMCFIKEKDENALIRAAAEWSFNAHLKQYPDRIKGCGK